MKPDDGGALCSRLRRLGLPRSYSNGRENPLMVRTHLLLPTSYFLLPTSYFLLPTPVQVGIIRSRGKYAYSSYFLLPTSRTSYSRTGRHHPLVVRTHFLLPTSYFLLPTSYFLLPTGRHHALVVTS